MKKTLVLILSLIVHNLNLISQVTKESKIKNLEIKAEGFSNLFKFDSAAYYYTKAAIGYESSEDWLNCARNYRLAARSYSETLNYDTALALSRMALNDCE